MRVAVLEVDRAGERVDGVGEAGGARALGLLLERQRGVDERRVDDAAVAAGALGAVQRALGEPHEAGLVARVARELRDPGAEGQGVPADRARGRICDGGAQPFDHALGAPCIGVGEREQELVAADPPADVAGPELALEDPGADPQRLVAGHVAGGVVEPREAVDVEHDHRHLLVAPVRGVERLVQGVVEPAVVEDAGERVGQRHARDLGLERALRAAHRVEGAREHPDGVVATPPLRDRGRGLAGGERERAVREPPDRAHERVADEREDPDQQQQRGPAGGEQHLAAARGHGAGARVEREAEPQHGTDASARVDEREGELRPLALADVTRLMGVAGRLDRHGGQVGVDADQPRLARRQPRGVAQVARRQRAGEDPRDGHRLRLPGPAVRVVDRPDRAVRREPAARHDERGRPGDQPHGEPPAGGPGAQRRAMQAGHALRSSA